MAPVSQKNPIKNINSDKKLEKKKWKEQKLLKAAAEFQKARDGIHEQEGDSKFANDVCFSGDSKQCTQHFSRSYTISIAVPGSILDNAQSQELRTYLAGQIARAACIFCVDEVIVFDDGGSYSNNTTGTAVPKPGENSCGQLARLLQFLECPQYLRKHIFPLHKELQYAGLLNPLDAPHHLRQADDFTFREGVVTHHLLKHGKGSFVNVGLLRDVAVDKAITPGIRVTVRMLPQKDGSKKRHGLIVSPSQPKTELGVYWGYTVRLASSLSDVFVKCPYQEGYDLTVGTSDKGAPLEDCDDSEFADFKNILIVFGGLAGLECALENDETLTINDVSLMFDKYLNTCSNQGSRTIRTEEAILISLSQITSKINANKVKSKITEV